jgi:hypothetical protein
MSGEAHLIFRPQIRAGSVLMCVCLSTSIQKTTTAAISEEENNHE